MTSVRNRATPRTPALNARTCVYLATTQIGWLLCVMTAASHRAAWGVAYALTATAGHLLFARRPSSEARLVVTVTVTGWLWDSAVAHSGLLDYPNGVLLNGTAPYWLAALWALFAIQLNTLLRWLRGGRSLRRSSAHAPVRRPFGRVRRSAPFISTRRLRRSS